MKIEKHFLKQAKRITVLGKGTVISPTRIVVHYTAGSTLSGAVSTLRKRGLSYNMLIDTDGSYHQARAFNRRSSHAGRSNWKAESSLTNSSSLNGHSIGISLVNLGQFQHFHKGRWWYAYEDGKFKAPSVKDEDANKMSSIYNPRLNSHWSPYPQNQIDSCHKLIKVLLETYPDITEIVGHDDIAIDYKPDPGPALPVQEWREEFGKEGGLGLACQVDVPGQILNLRDRPYHNGGQVIGTLKQGHKVYIRSVTYTSARSPYALIKDKKYRTLTAWASVDIDGSNKHAGFVTMRYLTKNPLSPAYAKQL